MGNQGRPDNDKKIGVLIGGSGLIGGGILHYFKTRSEGEFDLLAPNSKRLSLRDPEDIRLYLKRHTPDFIINTAITAIDSNPLLTFETNYLGTLNLAKAAVDLGIPYIHFSSAAVLPTGENLSEDDQLRLTPELANYPKSKLLAEMALQEMHRTLGLDYTNIRLAVVYGAHDHKIQGFQRMLFALADQTMPFLFTDQQAMHSYSNAKKVPFFVHHILSHREEFSGQTFHFVDPHPVLLSQLILTIKSYLELKRPMEVFLPYPLAKFGAGCMVALTRMLRGIGIESKMPPELMFLKNFYQTQSLSAAKLKGSSFVDPNPQATIFTELPMLIQYYLTRWEDLNLIIPDDTIFFDPSKRAEIFQNDPKQILASLGADVSQPFLDTCMWPRGGAVDSETGDKESQMQLQQEGREVRQ
ncbi:MAG: NAD(P)-dependent oxidoreductase [Desulfocapsaceae bacterium]|nr:NAD(P)-dependent oxidoreductase [Desulfocapsaceae bacterium]